MQAATKGKMSGSEKKKGNRNTKHFLHIIKRVTRKFLEISRCARQRQRNGPKKCAPLVKFCFLLIRPIFVVVLLFFVLFVFTVSLALHDFIFCLSKL